LHALPFTRIVDDLVRNIERYRSPPMRIGRLAAAKKPSRKSKPTRGVGQSGERKNEMMSVVVQDLSETDIENLAAYYSGIEISVKAPAQ
jgi:hypothetical protein